ncbi:MAG: DDE-type integrase/transposase/recombinase [Nanoarchaeota archaeon]|nr:DDE-type integrase/transposase/recombinase [Nanoarchaeota archaeon]MBU4086648.1 DDE-type integrase/transposase/recombinase [Nanoarchaeota archaeon]
MTNEIICPKCRSKEIVKRGYTETKLGGKKQRYYCKSCYKKFIPQNPFFRMRNTPEKITCALDLFFRGLSTREVQEHFKAFFPHNSDHSTILRWARKFSLKIASFTDNLKLNTGSYLELDEMEYHRRKSHKQKRGIECNWFIDSIDVKTRFMVSSAYVKHRSQNSIRQVLLRIKERAKDVQTITTDGLTAYTNIVKKTYGYNNKLGKYQINHKVVNASKGEGFNIWVERMHNTIRHRTKTFRGFHGSLESAYALMKGIEIYYNFIKKHEALKGKTPSELAIPSLKFETPNRWLELIKSTQ